MTQYFSRSPFVAGVLATLILVATLSSPSYGQGLGPATFQLIDGAAFKGTVDQIDESGIVTGENIPGGLKLGNVLSIVTDRKPANNNKKALSVALIGGTKIVVEQATLTGETLEFRSKSGAGNIPLQSVLAIVWKTSPVVERSVREPSTENDRIIVATDDGERQIEGVLEKIDSEFITVNYKSKSRKLAIAKVIAVVTADLGLPKLSGSLATVNGTDGSRIVGKIVKLIDGKLSVRVADQAVIERDAESIVDISIKSDRLLFLSDIEPTDVRESSVFAIQRPWKRDRSVENNPLRIRLKDSDQTVEFKKGIGTHASSRLVFANSNNFDRFRCVAGIDAETDGRGDCQMVVIGDGIELWSKRVRATDGPQDIDVDISEMKVVELAVYPGNEFDLGDHADWGNARFLKTK